jgi:inner membrane protein
MDNLCHTLAGIALGEAGLKKKTALATVTLALAANVPDVDALAYLWDPVTALGFRRGWTHGVLALALWPFALTGLLLAWDRWVRRRRDPAAVPADARGLLLLAAVGVLSHPLLDLLNTYGVRLLMPFSGRWFYGDTLFIVDPWVWLALLAGIIAARVNDRAGEAAWARPAQAVLAMVAAYIGLMAVSGRVVRWALERTTVRGGHAVAEAMVGPAPVNPFRRQVVLRLPDAYAVGEADLLRGRLFSPAWRRIPSGAATARARAAAATDVGRTFLSWARFPYFVDGADCPTGHVCIRDARYAGQGWAEVAVPVAGRLSLGPQTLPLERP